ncbi:MAG: VCBS repeat-containing protein [Planctomycetota bacterium]|nr:MAG: VCBS repeat-containing protein [Planctomycetota bacterium]REK38489.1 MAG: VCBS repeat-containing protein [Planctomycetota bacterium]
MAQANKNEPAGRRGASTQKSSGGSPAGWIAPVVVLAVGLGAIAWQSGLLGEADRPAEEADGKSADSAAKNPPSRPQLLTDSAELQLVRVRPLAEIDDPSSDGWKSEDVHLRLKKQLAKLGRLLTSPERATPEALAPLLTNDFRCAPLRPGELVVDLEDAALIVERGRFGDDAADAFRGAEGLAAAITGLVEPLGSISEMRHEFKVTRVEVHEDDVGEDDVDEDSVETDLRLALSGQNDDGFFEQHAHWVCEWKQPSGAKPKLHSLRVTRFEQTRARAPAASLFVDVTDSALRDTKNYREQILRGANHLFERIPFRSMLNLFSMPGIAVGDVNGDGLEDLYLCQDPGLPNRLYLQNRDGTAREVSRQWGVDWLEDARSALLVDLDNDGDQDLVVAMHTALVLAENDAQQTFRVKTVLTPSEDPTSLVALDYDMDGRLDLYVCAYHPDELLQESAGAALGAARERFVIHDANDGAANRLFRNVSEDGGPWKFDDVTVDVGLDVNNRRWSFAAAAEDYDNDGDLDLYVANDYGRDNLYRNDVGEDGGRHFVDVSDAAQIENSAGGMAVSWGDYDRDGWVDAYVSNMWSSAGHRVTAQRRFKEGVDERIRKRFRHVAEGNTLMRNNGKGVFANRTLEAGVEMGRWAWANRFFDLNNDGWQDLVVANGYMTTEDTGDL